MVVGMHGRTFIVLLVISSKIETLVARSGLRGWEFRLRGRGQVEGVFELMFLERWDLDLWKEELGGKESLGEGK